VEYFAIALVGIGLATAGQVGQLAWVHAGRLGQVG